MSLTSHLRARDSTVRGFFERELANTAEVVSRANDRFTAGRREPPLPSRGNPSLVATAAELILNAALHPRARPVASAPTLEAMDMLSVSQTALPSLVAPGKRLAADEWRIAARHALLLASFVSAYRSRQALESVGRSLHGAAATMDGYGDRLWQSVDEDDLIALASTALDDQAFVRDAECVVVNPTFTLSRRLGGADADVIVYGTLCDYKAGGQPRVVKREHIWQLVGYLLADTDDRYRLRAVGISALRWRSRHAWSAAELIGQLSGHPAETVDLPSWRTRFEAVVPVAQ